MKRIFCFVAVSSLLMVPLVFSEGDTPQEESSEESYTAGRVQLGLVQPDGVVRTQLPPGAQFGLPDGWKQRGNVIVVPELPGVGPGKICKANGVDCELGRRIAEMPPCTRLEDCQAADLWREQLGDPAIEKARREEKLRKFHELIEAGVIRAPWDTDEESEDATPSEDEP